MLYNALVNIAVRNTIGEYTIKDFNIFEIEKNNSVFSTVDVKNYKNKELVFKVLCPYCSEYHYYKYGINEIIKRDMVIGGCHIMGYPIIFIGNYSYISEKIMQFRKVNKRIYAQI